ncbi:MAG: hypothetical protein LBD70_03020 [Bifidobacteriaceae bacterium]|nr:hypothetical protein [Bifidobacteriaceae bacterium]
MISLAVFGVGALFLALAGIMFRIRAIANRKAWDGGTVPLTVIGLIVAAVGLALIYFNYPA